MSISWTCIQCFGSLLKNRNLQHNFELSLKNQYLRVTSYHPKSGRGRKRCRYRHPLPSGLLCTQRGCRPCHQGPEPRSTPHRKSSVSTQFFCAKTQVHTRCFPNPFPEELSVLRRHSSASPSCCEVEGGFRSGSVRGFATQGTHQSRQPQGV